jgi:hypothetical protein
MHILSGMGKVRNDLLLDGIPATIKTLEKVTNTARESLMAFRAPLKDMENYPHLLQVPPSKRQAIKVHRDVMVEAFERVDGYRTEFEHCQKSGIPSEEWEKIAENCKDIQLICILPNKVHHL